MNTDDRDPRFEISYLTKQLCVMVKVSPGNFPELDTSTLENLLRRVKKKLDAEKAAGNIDHYVLSKDALINIWPTLKQTLSSVGAGEQLAVRFAFGVKIFEYIHITQANHEETFCHISIDVPADQIKLWSLSAVHTYVKDYVLSRQWSTGSPDKDSLKKACVDAMSHPKKPLEVLKSTAPDGLEITKVRAKVASPVKAPANPTSSATTNTPVAPQSGEYPGYGLLQVAVDSDLMGARIVQFKVRWYDDPKLSIDEQWLRKELARLGTSGVTDEYIDRVNQKLVRKQDASGIQVAGGVHGTPGRSPFLAPCITGSNSDTPPSATAPLMSALTCEKGQIVAEIRYAVPAIPGTDVYGNPVPAVQTDTVEVTLGEGVEQVDSHHFRATQNGLVKIDGFNLSVVKAFVFEGDVTNNSGVINFKGDIQINGNIDVGAVISASGNINVDGSIRGGSIVCHGNLSVGGGVSTDEREAIRVDGEFKANFVERATIYCKGNITVENAIVQSKIYCGGSMLVTGSDGRIGASTIYLWGSLNTTKLGFATGAPTMIHMGEDWKEARRAKILKTRFERIAEKLEKDRSEERTLTRMKKEQLTKKRLEQKAQLRLDIVRLEAIAKRLEVKMETLKAQRKFNADVKLTTVYAPDGDVTVTAGGMPYQPVAPAA